MPNLFIIGGCNGAGKTTAYPDIIEKKFNCKNFVNADEIQKDFLESNPHSGPITAGKEFYKRIDLLASAKTDFAFETTLASKTLTGIINKCKSENYTIYLIFFWLDSFELAIERVKKRVSDGGHNIPENDIKRRYARGLNNLIEIYIPICDYWIVVDNTYFNSEYVAESLSKNNIIIHSIEKWGIINKK
ncbi:MAG: zeta toxin family protein [Ignavibacteria bacterium]|nr:zeta toxin family protein [Ignavibacteria bacterium]